MNTNRASVLKNGKLTEEKRMAICAKAAFLYLRNDVPLLEKCTTNANPFSTHSVKKNLKGKGLVMKPRRSSPAKKASKKDKKKPIKKSKKRPLSETGQMKSLAEANVSMTRIVRPEVLQPQVVAKAQLHSVLQWIVNMHEFGIIDERRLINILDSYKEIQMLKLGMLAK